MKEWYDMQKGKIVKVDAEAPVLVSVAPDDEEIAALATEYGIDTHDLKSAIDPDELGRYERERSHIVVILKRPCNYTGEGKLLFSVTSLGLFLFKNRLVVVSPSSIEFAGEKVLHGAKNVTDVAIKIMYGIINHFLGHLKVINMLSDSLEKHMTKSMGSRYLLDMFSLEKSLVYFVNGISSNQMVFERLVQEAGKLKLSKTHEEVLDDVVIENRQCAKQAEIYSDILMGLMGAHASVTNNNLNLLMKRLTVISVVFMPLNVLASMGGMSEFSQWTQGVPWFVAYGIFLSCLGPLGFLTYFILKRTGLEKGEFEKPIREGILKRIPRSLGIDRRRKQERRKV